jgi:hypothetical protein
MWWAYKRSIKPFEASDDHMAILPAQMAGGTRLHATATTLLATAKVTATTATKVVVVAASSLGHQLADD